MHGHLELTRVPDCLTKFASMSSGTPFTLALEQYHVFLPSS
jgi:hypothetical protein